MRLQGSDRWQQANINDPSLSAKLLSQAGLGPSVGAIVGSWVGAMVALVALALGVSCRFGFYKKGGGASLVAQWLRVCLPMQGTRVRALVWEDPTCRGATRPMSHNY